MPRYNICNRNFSPTPLDSQESDPQLFFGRTIAAEESNGQTQTIDLLPNRRDIVLEPGPAAGHSTQFRRTRNGKCYRKLLPTGLLYVKLQN